MAIKVIPYIIRLSVILLSMGLVLSVILFSPQLAYASGPVTDCTNDTDLHAKLAGGGVVTFNCASTPTTILLTTPHLPGSSYINITQTTTISGGGLITLQGNGGARIFNVDNSTMILDGMIISNGQALGASPNDIGGAIQIVNGGVVTITASTLVNNQASTLGGAIAAAANSKLAIMNSSLLNNQAGFGGAIYANLTKATIINSAIVSNTATNGDGGGIRSASTELTIANSTLSNNRALGSDASHGDGGGIGIGGSASISLITNTTIFSNSASQNGGGIQADSGSGSGIIKNTILADNTAVATGLNCSSASIISSGNNIDSGNSCNLSASGDLSNTDPLLGPLANNGGTTLTLALLAGSPAINAADNIACAADPINNVDQRGVLRPQGAICDIGAVEETSSLVIAKGSVNEGGEPLQPGELITYTIFVTNTSSLTATGGIISDTVPVHTTFVPGSIQLSPPSAGTEETAPPTLVSNLTIGAGQSVSVTYAVTVNTPLPNQTQVVNTASVTSSEVSEPQTSTVIDTVTSAPVLFIQKTSLDQNGGLLVSGDMISYTIVISNNGTANATGGVISDAVPANTSFVAGSLTLNPPGAGGIGTTPPTLASGLTITANQSISVSYAVTVNSFLSDQAKIVNTASVTSSELSLPQTSTVTDTVSAPVLSIQKRSFDGNGEELKPGDTLTYTIVVTNLGTSKATGGVISDTMPMYISFVPGSLVLEPAGAGVVGVIPPMLVSGLTITPTQAVTVSYRVVVSAGLTSPTQIVNTASVTSSEISLPKTSTVIDTVTTNNQKVYLPLIQKN